MTQLPISCTSVYDIYLAVQQFPNFKNKSPIITVEPPSLNNKFIKEEHCHDAGFDSYMTGYIFLNYLYFYELSPLNFLRNTSLNQPRTNVYIYIISIFYLLIFFYSLFILLF